MNSLAPLPSLPADLRWQACAFDRLGVRELEAIYRARQTVFILEQNCVYLDADGVDAHSHHVAAWSATQPMPLAYARLVPPGIKYAEPSMGRVLTLPAARGLALGRELVRQVLALAATTYPGLGMRISAQARLDAFYAGYGFETVGEVYLEDDMPHVEMVLAPTAARRP